MNVRHAAVRRAPWFVAVALSACVAGPDFKPPAAPPVARYTPEPPVDPAPQRYAEPKATGRWWSAFSSVVLDALVGEALQQHPSMGAAADAVAQAGALAAAERAATWPRLSLGLTAARGNELGSSARVSSERALGPDVSWSPDLNGAAARRIEQAQALQDERRAAQADTALQLASAVVSHAIDMAAADERHALLRHVLAFDESAMRRAESAWRGGSGTQGALLDARARLDADWQEVSSAAYEAAAARRALARLCGHFAGEWMPPAIDLDQLVLPTDLPLRVPSELVRQRPDILAAQARLHVASASIGIASANLYPTVTLDSGWTIAATPATVAGGGQGVWSLAASVLAPFFDGHLRQARKQAASDAYAAQAQAYRGVVLDAFGEVADAMKQLERDAAEAGPVADAWRVAEQGRRLACASVAAGRGTPAECLAARRSEAVAQMASDEQRARRLKDSLRWFVAMGGSP